MQINNNLSKEIETAIQTNIPCDSLAETLYTMLCKASAMAGAKLRWHPPAPYSKEIHRLRIIVRLHKLIVSQLQTGYNLGDSITSTKNKLESIRVHIPETVREAIASHHAYKKELWATIREEEKNRHLQKHHLNKLGDT